MLGASQSAPDLDLNENGFGVAVWWNNGLQSHTWDPAYGLNASFTATPDPGIAGVGVQFDAQASSGPFPITSYDWDWDNNGTFDTNGGPVLSRVFETAGTYTTRLRVTDSTSRTVTTTRTVNVVPVGEVTSRVIVNYRGPGDGALEIRSAQPGFMPVRCETHTRPAEPTDTGTCSATVLAGYDISVVADYDPVRSIFSGWSEDAQQCRTVVGSTTPGGTRSECQFLANSLDRTFDVSFMIAPPATEILRIELHPFSQGGGDIYSQPTLISCTVENQLIRNSTGGNCSYSIPGSTITVVAVPARGNGFIGWEGCTSQPSERECQVTMDGLHTIRARFSGG